MSSPSKLKRKAFRKERAKELRLAKIERRHENTWTNHRHFHMTLEEDVLGGSHTLRFHVDTKIVFSPPRPVYYFPCFYTLVRESRRSSYERGKRFIDVCYQIAMLAKFAGFINEGDPVPFKLSLKWKYSANSPEAKFETSYEALMRIFGEVIPSEFTADGFPFVDVVNMVIAIQEWEQLNG